MVAQSKSTLNTLEIPYTAVFPPAARWRFAQRAIADQVARQFSFQIEPPAQPQNPSVADIDAVYDEDLSDEQADALLAQRAAGSARATVPLARFPRS